MTARSADVIEMKSRRRRRRSPPFAKLSKVLTEPDLPLRANERLVALVTFQYANLKTMQCWPSIETIARRANVSRHTVIRAVKKLQHLGLVTVTKTREKGKFDRSVYDFSPLKRRRNLVSK